MYVPICRRSGSQSTCNSWCREARDKRIHNTVGCPLAFFAAPASAPANRPKASCSDRQRSAASRAAAYLPPLLAACRMLEQADAPTGDEMATPPPRERKVTTPDATAILRRRMRKLQREGLPAESGRRALATVLEQETPPADRAQERQQRALEISANKVSTRKPLMLFASLACSLSPLRPARSHPSLCAVVQHGQPVGRHALLLRWQRHHEADRQDCG